MTKSKTGTKNIRFMRAAIRSCAALVTALALFSAVGCDALTKTGDKEKQEQLKAITLSFEDKNAIGELLWCICSCNYDSGNPKQEGMAVYLTTHLHVGLIHSLAYPTSQKMKFYSPYDDSNKFKKDPLKAFDFSDSAEFTLYGYAKYKGSDVDWILKNIMNVESTHPAKPTVFYEEEDVGYDVAGLRYYYYKGYYYVECSGMGDDFGKRIMFDRVVSDGSYYHIQYRYTSSILLESGKVYPDALTTAYATLKKNTVDDEEYWSVVKMSDKPYFDFSTYYDGDPNQKWRKLYVKEIKKLNKEYESDTECAIAYINDDDIPELIINTTIMAGGGEVCTVYNDKMSVLPVWCYGVSYLDRQNILLNRGGRMEDYFDDLYHIDKGKFVETAKGEYGLYDESYYDDENFDWEHAEDYFTYKWNAKEVTKAQYKKSLKKIYDKSSAINPYKNSYSASFMISMLNNDFYDYYPVTSDPTEDE